MNETITVKYDPLHYNQENDFRWFLESAVEAYKESKDDDIAFYQLMEWMRDFAIEQIEENPKEPKVLGMGKEDMWETDL